MYYIVHTAALAPHAHGSTRPYMFTAVTAALDPTSVPTTQTVPLYASNQTRHLINAIKPSTTEQTGSHYQCGAMIAVMHMPL